MIKGYSLLEAPVIAGLGKGWMKFYAPMISQLNSRDCIYSINVSATRKYSMQTMGELISSVVINMAIELPCKILS